MQLAYRVSWAIRKLKHNNDVARASLHLKPQWTNKTPPRRNTGFLSGIHRWSSHKGPLIWKAFPCHFCFMSNLCLYEIYQCDISIPTVFTKRERQCCDNDGNHLPFFQIDISAEIHCMIGKQKNDSKYEYNTNTDGSHIWCGYSSCAFQLQIDYPFGFCIQGLVTWIQLI